MKNLTKKKKLIILIVSIVVAVSAIGAGSIAYGYDVVKKNSIGIDNAIATAMQDAGVTEQDAVITKAKMSFDDGRFVYDIEFTANGLEYDYELKASDGAIIKKDKDTNDRYVETTTGVNESTQTVTQQEITSQSADQQTTQAQTQNAATNKGDISLDKAKSIALSNAGLKADAVTFTKAQLDYDDGVSHYEIEFYNDSYEYDYDIDMSGNIVSYDRDARKAQNNQSNQSSSANVNSKYIGIDKAKSVALENAGKKSSEVNFTKAKLEKDDGVWKYEIEFVAGTMEYEYDIDAVSGKVLSHDADSIYD